MHVPSFILYFFLAGVPLIVIGKRVEETRHGRIVSSTIVLISLVFAAYMSWGAAPITEESNCRPAGPGIYSDC